MEPEKASERRRGWRAAAVRCAVVLAACALLVSLAALALMLLRGLEAPESAEKLRGTQEPRQESQACAVLVEDGSPIIETRKLKWVPSNTECKAFSEEFDYDNNSGMLKIKSESEYYIWARMAAECFFEECEKRNVTLIIHHKTAQNSDPILSLSLHLYPRSNRIFSASMAISFPLKQNDLLYVTLISSTSNDLRGWQLKNPDIIFRISRDLGAVKS